VPDLSVDPVERALVDAGERWRAAQEEPAQVDPALFTSDSARSFGSTWPSRAHLLAFLAGVAASVVVLVALLVGAPGLVPRIGGGGPVPPIETGYIPTGLAHCPLSKPDGLFSPPAQAGVRWEDIDPGHAWYGSADLWTMLDRDGEVWTGLPRSELGLGQKTFWWRQGYDVRSEPTPEIYVTGKRLDGPGRFTFGPGTNAFWGLGSAMLVGVEVPEGGCWELTARYFNRTLSYVVWVEDVSG
jgi:hypothetical protein